MRGRAFRAGPSAEPTLLRSGDFLGEPLRRRDLHDLVLADMLYPAGLRLPRHLHERPYFCLIRSGTYEERFCRRSRSCGPMMLVFHPAGERHAQQFDRLRVASFNVELGPRWVARMDELGGRTDQPFEFHGGRPVALAVQLFRELRQSDDEGGVAIESLLWEMLAAGCDEATAARAGSAPPAWLDSARDLLDSRSIEPLSLGGVATEVGVHPVYLASMFRRHFGCSIGEYLRRQRVEVARRKLAEPELSLAEIAIAAGFSDQSHFNRTFKRLTGMTPGQYRTFLRYKTH